MSCDNENVLVAGVNQAKALRNKVGASMIPQFGKNYSKGRTAMAERAIQTVRNQAKTLIHCVEDFAKVKFDDKHVLHSWSYLHAGWLLNHFHVHSALKSTPYQMLMGRPYRGRVCSFGTIAVGLDGTLTKNKATWVRGVWVGKDQSDHDLLVTDDGRILRAKAVRQTGDLWDAEALSSIHLVCHLWCFLLQRVLRHQSQIQAGEKFKKLHLSYHHHYDLQSWIIHLIHYQNSPMLHHRCHSLSFRLSWMVMRLALLTNAPWEKESSPRMTKKASKIKFDISTNTHKVVYEDEEKPKKMKPPPFNAVISSSSERPSKSSRTGESLSSSPAFAGNIHRVKSYSGVEMWVDDEDLFDPSFAADIENSVCFDEYVDDIEQNELPSEADGPPTFPSDELLMLDNEAGMEEIKRLFDLDVLEGCEVASGDEVLLTLPETNIAHENPPF